MSDERVQTLRLTVDQYELLRLIARTEGKSLSAVIREAIDAHIARRKADPEFQRKLIAWQDKNIEIFKRLSA